MADLFTNMLKEEWRIHSTMFGSLNFALFPVMIAGIAFMGTFLLPLIRSTMSGSELVIMIHSSYLMFGFMIGAFGLIGNEIMSRHFGDASLLAYAARILPFSSRHILSVFVIKDILYYFAFWILPLVFGFLIGSIITGIPLDIPLRLMLTLTLSFMSGLSICFFLSSIYGRSQRMLILLLILAGLGLLFIYIISGINPALYYPPVLIFNHFSWEMLILSLLLIIVPFAFALLIFSPDSSSQSGEYPSRMKPFLGYMSWLSNSPLVAKDLIDLWRSGILIGQTIFSFIIPLLVIWFFLSLLIGLIPPASILFSFATVTGIIASTMYTWLSITYSSGFYAMLPVSASSVIKSRIFCFTLLQPVPICFLSCIAILSGLELLLIPILVLMISISYYGLSVTVWLTGLTPNEMLYNVRVMGLFFLLIGSVLAIFSAISLTNTWYSLFAVFLFIPTYLFIRKGLRKWEFIHT